MLGCRVHSCQDPRHPLAHTLRGQGGGVSSAFKEQRKIYLQGPHSSLWPFSLFLCTPAAQPLSCTYFLLRNPPPPWSKSPPLLMEENREGLISWREQTLHPARGSGCSHPTSPL